MVYLDADTVAVRNMDELFLCDGLCGVLRHSERINTGVWAGLGSCPASQREAWSGFAVCDIAPSTRATLPECLSALPLPAEGVMALTPSTQLFNAMMDSIATTPSYTGGDQGFLNALFAGGMLRGVASGVHWMAANAGSRWQQAAGVWAVWHGSRRQDYGLAHACKPTARMQTHCPISLSIAHSADWAAAPLFDPRQGRLLSESTEWRTSTPAARGLPVRACRCCACLVGAARDLPELLEDYSLGSIRLVAAFSGVDVCCCCFRQPPIPELILPPICCSWAGCPRCTTPTWACMS